jgi:hypothetical protein
VGWLGGRGERPPPNKKQKNLLASCIRVGPRKRGGACPAAPLAARLGVNQIIDFLALSDSTPWSLLIKPNCALPMSRLRVLAGIATGNMVVLSSQVPHTSPGLGQTIFITGFVHGVRARPPSLSGPSLIGFPLSFVERIDKHKPLGRAPCIRVMVVAGCRSTLHPELVIVLPIEACLPIGANGANLDSCEKSR